jgi:hypothetical protein
MRRPGWLTCVYGGLLAAVVAFGGALLYLKLHESELVFRTALSHQRATGQLPPDAERLVIREAGGSQLAAVILRPEPPMIQATGCCIFTETQIRRSHPSSSGTARASSSWASAY